uniref:uncharacterized protein LOC100182381 n=1 Tax=Ciona intestinalis TaxID=7719 RepID=UPI0002B8E48B|nr:uncharacterized protein LOC100182381 [Ciona intestinalis]|eukprot:XP_002130145.2 uncharacterized protein LOC100182381 [Ciona intestinalis]
MEAAAARREQEPRPLTSKLHIVCTTMLIMAGMGLLDGYLVDQNLGSRRTGVFVMLLIGDVCLLLVLRYVALWVGSEVRTSKRGSSMIEWFLFVFVLDIKMYFILESVRKKCSAVGMVASSAPLKSASANAPPGKMMTRDVNDDDLLLDPMTVYDNDPIMGSLSSPFVGCEYSLIAKKSLTLFQAIVIGGLYLLLVGADHLKHLPDLRSLEEVKMRAFWVVIDLLDILELQSTMWETTQGELPYLVVGFVYFYCYIVLIILPPLALAEMNKGEGETRPHEMLIYLVASLCVVNVGSTAIRCVLLFRHKFANTSTIFIGKNIICLGMKITRLIQIRLIESGRLHFTPSLEMTETDNHNRPPNMLPNGNLICSDGMNHKCESEDGEDEKSLCPQHGYKNNFSPRDHWKDAGEHCTEGSEEFLNHCEDKSRSAVSDYSTFAQTSCSVADGVPTSQSNYGDEKITMTYKNGPFSKQVKFYGKNEAKTSADEANCRICSATSCSDVSSLLNRKTNATNESASNTPASAMQMKAGDDHTSLSYHRLDFAGGVQCRNAGDLQIPLVPGSIPENRRSCIVSSFEPPSTSAAPVAWHSSNDVTRPMTLSNLPSELDVHHWRAGDGLYPATSSECAANRFDRGYLSDSEVSDYAPQPPSMTLMDTKTSLKAETHANSRSCSAHSAMESDAESTSV